MRNSSAAAGRLIGLLSLFVAASVVAGALFAGLFVPAVAAAGGATKGSITWFNDLKAVPPIEDLSQASVLLAADGTDDDRPLLRREPPDGAAEQDQQEHAELDHRDRGLPIP